MCMWTYISTERATSSNANRGWMYAQLMMYTYMHLHTPIHHSIASCCLCHGVHPTRHVLCISTVYQIHKAAPHYTSAMYWSDYAVLTGLYSTVLTALRSHTRTALCICTMLLVMYYMPVLHWIIRLCNTAGTTLYCTIYTVPQCNVLYTCTERYAILYECTVPVAP